MNMQGRIENFHEKKKVNPKHKINGMKKIQMALFLMIVLRTFLVAGISPMSSIGNTMKEFCFRS